MYMYGFRASSKGRVACAAGALLIVTSCGSGATTPVVPTPSPVPTATPAPAPTPTPVPSPSPCSQGLCEEPTTSTERAARVTMRLYTVEDGRGNFISNPDPDDPIPIGWYARIDVTAKDQSNNPTNGRGSVRFQFDPDYVVEVLGSHTHQRRLRGLQTGDVQCSATLDGVTSNVVTLKFRPI